MHTNTVTVKLEYRDDGTVSCIIDSDSTSSKVAEEMLDGGLKTAYCLTAFSTAISTLCAAMHYDAAKTMELMKGTVMKCMDAVNDIKIELRPTN